MYSRYVHGMFWPVPGLTGMAGSTCTRMYMYVHVHLGITQHVHVLYMYNVHRVKNDSYICVCLSLVW